MNLQKSLTRRLAPLGYALAVAIVLIMTLTWGVLQVQITLAGFLNSESVWSKAQKQSVIDLGNYAISGDARDLASFDRNYDLLDVDRAARDAIASGRSGRAEVKRAFEQGNVMPAATSGIQFLLRYFSHAPHMRKALAAWRSTDGPLDQLYLVSEQLRERYRQGALPASEIASARAQINQLNVQMEPYTERFSVELVRGAVWAGQMLFWGVFLAFCMAAVLWLRMARSTLQRIRGSEERYQLLFDSADDAIVLVDESSGQILDVNRAAAGWTGRAQHELIGANFRGLFVNDPMMPQGDGATSVLFDAADGAKPVEMRSSVAQWGEQSVRQAIVRDISERVAMEQERRVASKALGSIAEGVIIADADRRVVSVNAAHVEITGFTAQSMRGMRLDQTRRMPDDRPMSEAIWQAVETGGNWHGEVVSARSDGSRYPERLSLSAIRDSEGRVQHYVAVLTNISSSKADRRRLEHLATHDPLTGLSNRAEFERRCTAAIERAAIEKTCMAVLFVDLDAFKIINDSYSHATGDRLLVKVAETIACELGDNDEAGRIGGDEFTLLSAGLASRDEVEDLARRLLLALAEPLSVGDHEITISASIGVAAYPLDGEDTPTLIANADSAMYAAKSEERNAFRFYTPLMQADARKRLQLAGDLRRALANNEFHLVFQPSIDMQSGRVVAVEVLLRWDHPTRGLMMPDDFIPTAESLGLIRAIDEWVLRVACAEIASWEREQLPDVRVAVNVSASWFGHAAFVQTLHAALIESGVAARRLLLEITESAILRLGESTERTMRALDELGVGVAIDDFGTGYSSLAYLKLPSVVCLKIDRSFVEGLPDSANDVAIVQAVLAISRSLGIYTIAEGIENQAQHEFLRAGGCEEGQGYLYARPLIRDELWALLRGELTIMLPPPLVEAPGTS